MAHRLMALAVSVSLVAALSGGGGSLAAQQPAPPQCRVNFRSNFRLNGAQQYLASAEATRYPEDKARRAGDAIRVLTEAAQSTPPVDQLTLWFFFGQAYALRRDLVGADSAFTRAEAVADAECQREIARRRRNEFVPFNNEGVGHMQAQHLDSALASFRRGLVIFRGEPALYINMASIYLNQGTDDSAVANYRLAARATDDPRTETMRLDALFNAARILQRGRHWAVADTVYRDYLRVRPRDPEARAGLAGVLAALGDRAGATALYDSIMADADSLSSFDLFQTGIALFRQAQADTATADSAQRRSLYGKAAQAFELGLRKNPSLRDALFNLANTYLAAGDTARALDASKRLVAVDPNNTQSLRLLAASYREYSAGYDAVGRRAVAARDTATIRRVRPLLLAYQDSTLRILGRMDSLPWDFTVVRFEPRDSTAVIRGAVSNRQNRELPPFTLNLEFVNEAGEVVAREAVEIPAMSPTGAPGALYDFNLTPSGRGIIAYRYRTS